jgi:hypothetical protein
MNKTHRTTLLIIVIAVFICSCDGPPPPRPKPKPKEIVKIPEEMDPTVQKQISGLIGEALVNNGKIDDSIVLSQPTMFSALYDDRGRTATLE